MQETWEAQRQISPHVRSLSCFSTPPPCCLLSEFTCCLSSEVIILSGSSVIFRMVSLPEPKYKNAGGPDSVFSRKGGEGAAFWCTKFERAPVKSTNRLENDVGSPIFEMNNLCFDWGEMSRFLTLYCWTVCILGVANIMTGEERRT